MRASVRRVYVKQEQADFGGTTPAGGGLGLFASAASLRAIIGHVWSRAALVKRNTGRIFTSYNPPLL